MLSKQNNLRANFGIIWFLVLFFGACSPTKYVPEGRQLLVKNKIYLNEERERSSDPNALIRQKPNKSISVPGVNWVLWRPYLQIYNLGNPDSESGFGHWLTQIGEAPTILDSAATISSAGQLGQYYFNHGYFLNEVGVEVKRNKPNKRASIVYTIFAGPQYSFGQIEYIISSPGIANTLAESKINTLIEYGKPYSTDVLEAERNRITTNLRNNGYYAFPKSLVRFEADTSAGNHLVNIRLIVSDQPASVGDSLYYIEHQPYNIRNVYTNPMYGFGQQVDKPTDTTLYEGIYFTQNTPPNYKASYLESNIHFKKGDTYNEAAVKETYAHLTGNRVFQIAEISFSPVPGDSTNQLDATIHMQPYRKNTITFEAEATNTSGNYGIGGAITYALRNVFGGGEIFDASLKGGLQAQVNVSQNSIFNTVETGVETGLNFPRFFLAGNLNKRIHKRMEPKSRVFTSFNYQTRVEFERYVAALGLLYNWRESETKRHQINLIDLNYVRLPRIDQSYLNSLEFKSGFQDNLIMASRYTFLFDNQKVKQSRNKQFLRFSLETAGNLLAAINGSGNFPLDVETNQYQVLNAPFAQYVRLDADFRNYYQLSKTHQLVTRAFVGATLNYGNSPFLPPFEKSFLAGGSNDIRGWTAYRLGPGNFPGSLYNQANTNYAAVAPLKLLASIEYRFPIFTNFFGALFADAGNIWLWNKDYSLSNPGEVEQALLDYGIFKFDSFLEQSALNTGLGWRYDFGFFALRLDMGMKIYDPTEAAGNRFVLWGLRWNTINYNIALGYPF